MARNAIHVFLAALAPAIAAAGDESAPGGLRRVDDIGRVSVFESATFEASIGRPVHVGEITDFRLERLGEEAALALQTALTDSADE